jgi:hypothetical protein
MLPAPDSLPSNPLDIFWAVLGTVVSIPVMTFAAKGVIFITRATDKLDMVVDKQTSMEAKQAEFSDEFREFCDVHRDELQATAMSFSILEGDVNALQEKAGVTQRRFPDRRTGPADRRHPV